MLWALCYTPSVADQFIFEVINRYHKEAKKMRMTRSRFRQRKQQSLLSHVLSIERTLEGITYELQRLSMAAKHDYGHGCENSQGRPRRCDLDSTEYRKVIREARNGNPRPLQAYLKKTKGQIPETAGRG
jgi:hypothetical protein